jgi:orotate phosphoribosyltransferase
VLKKINASRQGVINHVDFPASTDKISPNRPTVRGNTIAELDEKRAALLALLRRDAFKTGDFTLASGAKSSYYIDGRLLTLSSDGARLLAEVILDMASGDRVDAVGGMTMGADPIVGAVLAMADARGRRLNGFICRKETKEHGTRKKVEGHLAAGDRVLMVEDVVTTGGSTLRAIDAVEEIGGGVVRIIAMVDRLAGAAEAFADRGYNFTPVFTVRDLGVGG